LIDKINLYISVNECPEPNTTNNSKLLFRKSVFQYKDVITFVCDVGYMLQGSSQLTCQANKTWDMDAPICRSKYKVFFINYIWFHR